MQSRVPLGPGKFHVLVLVMQRIEMLANDEDLHHSILSDALNTRSSGNHYNTQLPSKTRILQFHFQQSVKSSVHSVLTLTQSVLSLFLSSCTAVCLFDFLPVVECLQ